MSSGARARRGRREAYATIAVTVVTVTAVMVFTDGTRSDPAAAGLGAAIIGIAGTSLGHEVGLDHERRRAAGAVPAPRAVHAAWYALVAVALAVGVLALPAAALVVEPSLPRVSADALAALIAAVVGIVATDVAHSRWLSRADQRWLGWAFLGVGSLGGLALIHVVPDRADVVAAIATTGIAVGGALVGFARGRRAARP